jgi:hypothetical protein
MSKITLSKSLKIIKKKFENTLSKMPLAFWHDTFYILRPGGRKGYGMKKRTEGASELLRDERTD